VPEPVVVVTTKTKTPVDGLYEVIDASNLLLKSYATITVWPVVYAKPVPPVIVTVPDAGNVTLVDDVVAYLSPFRPEVPAVPLVPEVPVVPLVPVVPDVPEEPAGPGAPAKFISQAE